MQRTVSLLLVVAIWMAPTATAQDPVDPLTAQERAWLANHGPIRYAPDPDYPPFEFVRDDGTVAGINTDFLNRISRNLGIEFETVIYDNWTAVLEAMQAGEVDLLGSLAQTEERDAYMDFLGPYMSVGEVFYVNTGRADLQQESDLEGKRIAVVESYAAATWLAENRPGLEQVPVDNIQQGLELLSSGQVDAFFENVPVTGYYIRQLSYGNIRILGEPLYYSEANWGVPDGNAILLSIMQKGMDSIPLGEQTKIFEYWSGYDLGVARPESDGPLMPTWAWFTLGGVALIALIGVGLNWVLRNQIRRRTAELRESRDALAAALGELETRVEARTRELSELAGSLSHIHQVLEANALGAKRAIQKLNWEVRNRYHGIIKPPAMSLLDSTSDEVAKLCELIDDVGHLGASGKPSQHSVRLEGAFSEACQELSKSRHTVIQLDCKGPVEALGDPGMLRALARKFVLHALEVSPRQPVRVRLEMDAETAEPFAVSYEVESGVLNAMDRIAEPLGPAGLALSAAARILHRHGADLSYSAEGTRLVIRFNLPAITPELESAEPES